MVVIKIVLLAAEDVRQSCEAPLNTNVVINTMKVEMNKMRLAINHAHKKLEKQKRMIQLLTQQKNSRIRPRSVLEYFEKLKFNLQFQRKQAESLSTFNTRKVIVSKSQRKATRNACKKSSAVQTQRSNSTANIPRE